MKIKPIIEGPCVIVPQVPVMERLSDAGGTRLKVLLYILAKPDFDPEEAAETLNITVKSFNHSIDYWQKAGAISLEEGSVKEAKKTTQAKTQVKAAENVTVERPRAVARASQLPRYTSDEVAAYVEENNRRPACNVSAVYGQDVQYCGDRDRRGTSRLSEA